MSSEQAGPGTESGIPPATQAGLERLAGSGPAAPQTAAAAAPVGPGDASGRSATPPAAPSDSDFVRPIAALRVTDTAFAGGKGANLGELAAAGLPVPPAFVIGAPAYAAFCDQTGLRARLAGLLDGLDVESQEQLTAAAEAAQQQIAETRMPDWLRQQILAAHSQLAPASEPVAVRSSATAEDTAEASFAGMNETFLNVISARALIDAVQSCWRSLFGARTIYYRGKQGLGQASMDIAVIVQRQIDSRRSGVMFTVNPATGDRSELVIEGAFGLGEAVVSGSVSPDRYVVGKEPIAIRKREVRHKELAIERDAEGGTRTRMLGAEESMRVVLNEEEVGALARIGCQIERHYQSPQDTEWAFDAEGRIWMLQSRPITTLAGPGGETDEVLLRGLGAAPGRASGAARILASLQEAGSLADGEVLVTHMTAPDWVPLMRRAAAIVTDSGGMTCHAAIVSRELGIPAVVGTGEATSRLRDGELLLVDATKGVVLAGDGPAAAATAASLATPASASAGAATVGDATAPIFTSAPPVTATKLLVNLSEPSQIERAANLDVDGVGLLRAELMVLEALDGEHPRMLLQEGRGETFVTAMSAALEAFASAFQPRPITYRTIDFRSNEFRGLRGGEDFEPQEANPMIGFRGALRYERQPEVFALELAAIKRVWDNGHRNLHLMLPFVRTVGELAGCRRMIADAGLAGADAPQLWIMAEVPSVLFNLRALAEQGIHGISIGSNDLTQLLLGADRDNELLAATFDERDSAVTAYIRQLIAAARELGLESSICGQAPSVHPEYAQLLVDAGIDAVSVNIDAVTHTRRLLAAAEQRLLLEAARARGGGVQHQRQLPIGRCCCGKRHGEDRPPGRPGG